MGTAAGMDGAFAVAWTVTHAPPVVSDELLDASRDTVDTLAAPDDRTECSVGPFAPDLDTEHP